MTDDNREPDFAHALNMALAALPKCDTCKTRDDVAAEAARLMVLFNTLVNAVHDTHPVALRAFAQALHQMPCISDAEDDFIGVTSEFAEHVAENMEQAEDADGDDPEWMKDEDDGPCPECEEPTSDCTCAIVAGGN